MSEKKTFKHPLGLTSAFGNFYTKGKEGGEYEIFSEGEGLHRFPLDEWDIEVTFTKKVKPLAVGDVIKYDNYNDSRTATIIAIDDDECWLKFSDDSHATWELSEVRR